MKSTIVDIAKRAGVSPSTVSRVITGNLRISEETTEKVQKIMKEMNYYPNMIARSLAKRLTRIIGVLIPGDAEKALRNPFFPEILRGISTAAHNNGYKVLLSSVNNPSEEKKAIKDFARGGIAEGVVLLTSRTKDPSIAELLKIGFPFVVVGKPERDRETNWVDNDNFAVGYELTKHLLELGHEKIAFLGVCSEFFFTVERLKGYKKALNEYGIEIRDDLIVESGFVDDSGYDLMNRLFQSGAKPTAVIACDDLLAFGVIKSINEHEMSVPRDIAVAGFNNVPLSEHSMPPLTTVEINPFALGHKAVQLLVANLQSDCKSFNRAIIPADLIIRKSTLKL